MIEVEWIDSVGSNSWEPRNQALAEATEEQMRCRSVGYLLTETDHSILIAQSLKDEGSNVADTLQIPTTAVVQKRRLRQR